MEKEGIIRRSTSPWASPLHMVAKKDGSWRPCGDFRRLNLVTEPDRYPLPNMLDFADRLHGCTVFSKIDLRKGYWQIPVRNDDIKKTAVITPFGLFEFLRLPFGLRNAGSSFQRTMDRVTLDMPFTYCYLDDLRVASPDLETHLQHLAAVFTRLRDFGLVINLEKCVFCVQSFEFLGHHVSSQGARPVVSYVEAVDKMMAPTTVKELQIFLGLINFYRRFLAGIQVPHGEAGVDGVYGGKLPASQGCPEESHVARPPRSAGITGFARRCLCHPRRGCVAATIERTDGVEAVGVLLAQVGGCPDQMECVRPGTASLCGWHQAFSIYSRGSSVHNLHRP
jgi:hypothetical protein